MSDADTQAPDVIRELAEACTRFVDQALGMKLDYTQDTLPILDHYLSETEEAEEEVVGLVAPAVGAYFGEVVRRHVGAGTWETPPDDYPAWRLRFEEVGMAFNPIGVALEVIAQDDAEGWGAEFKVREEDKPRARDAVEVLGEVTAEQYYSLSVRFEVAEQLYETLRRPAPGKDGGNGMSKR